MKYLQIASLAVLVAASAAYAAPSTLQLSDLLKPSDQIAHGGGCRKDSPPGKCCHAGSKPLHCH